MFGTVRLSTVSKQEGNESVGEEVEQSRGERTTKGLGKKGTGDE